MVGMSCSDTEEADDADEDLPTCASTASKIGDGGVLLLAELEEELSSGKVVLSSSSSSWVSGLKTPPWIGGRKLTQRPSIFPMTNFRMRA